MFFSGIRTYLNFLSRHKVYTFVSVAGFSISLAFVIILSFYAKTQVSMDSFHEKKDRIYMLMRDRSVSHASPVGDYVMDVCPEVESYVRVVYMPYAIGVDPKEWLEVDIVMADPDFFNVFSFPLLEGDPHGALLSKNNVVLSQSTAFRLFGADPAVGRTVLIDGDAFTVTGIMADFPYYTHLKPPEAIINYDNISRHWGEDIFGDWSNCSFTFYFLIKENSDIYRKSDLLRDKFMEDYWVFRNGTNTEVGFLPLENVFFSGVSAANIYWKRGSLNTTRIYMGIALLVLIIALLNYVNMTVAQAGFRCKAAAVRKLLGSGRRRIVIQMLYESLLMTVLSAMIAVFLALIAEPFFDRILGVTLGLKESFDGTALLWIALAILFLSVAGGIVPALTVASVDPIEVVKGTIRRRIKTRISKPLIIMQFAVCIGLLICTILMYSQASYFMNKDVGFEKENILVLDNVGLKVNEFQGIKDAWMRIPGVESVAFGAGTPLDGGNHWTFDVNGAPVSMQILMGDSSYFQMFGLNITPTIDATVADGDIIYLNRAAFNAICPDSLTMRFGQWSDNAVIAGIFDDIHISSLHFPIGPTLFTFLGDDDYVWAVLIKLSSEDIYKTTEKVCEVYTAMNGNKPFGWFFSQDEIYEWYQNEWRMSAILGVFTILSVIIMVMGVFAMSLYMIRQKEKEIGVRKVNGATVNEILRLLNGQSLLRVVIAFVIACPVAYYAMSVWLRNFAYRIDITIWPFLLSGAAVTMLCLVSVSWQTFRAARANPVESLKSE